VLDLNTVLRKFLAALCALSCWTPPAVAQAAEPPGGDPFAGAVFRTREARTGRVSSWDQTGGNADFLSFKAGETKELVRLGGPGVLTHIYVTPGASKAFLRTAVLRMYWDDEQNPSVEVPFGDFFCAGDCNPRLFASRFVVVNHGSGNRSAKLRTSSTARTDWDPLTSCPRERSCSVKRPSKPVTVS